MKLLPLGSVVQLKRGQQKLMITCRYPLYNNQGTIGYFDYSACLYPTGNPNGQAYFFNQEDISEVYFKGYLDDDEKKLVEKYSVEISKVSYPHLTLEVDD